MMISFLSLLLLLLPTAQAHPAKQRINLVGVGYNLLEGNPEGSPDKGGVDPGLKVTRQILKLTYNTDRNCSDGPYSVPDQVLFRDQLHCQTSESTEVVTGAQSYQRQLQSSVSTSFSGGYGLFSVAFAASSRYKSIEHATTSMSRIYVEKVRVCHRGKARYEKEKAAGNDDFALGEGFVEAVKLLPSRYDMNVYGRFLDNWGTHVVTSADLGATYREISFTTSQKIFEYALQHDYASLSASASYGNVGASLSVDVSRLTTDSSFLSTFSHTKKIIVSGSSSIQWDSSTSTWKPVDTPEYRAPIHLDLDILTDVISPVYISDQTVLSRKQNIEAALRDYPKYKRVTASSADNGLQMPVAWPKGNYGLVKESAGCPADRNSRWREGWRKHDTEDDSSNNQWKDGIQYALQGRLTDKNNMEWKFCMKYSDGAGDVDYKWPRGEYCIFRSGYSCPSGFGSGYIKWDDEDDNNANGKGGYLPYGHYDRNTKIYFCCRRDGSWHNRIVLPKNKSFILIAASQNCQKVFGMRSTRYWFRWDNEDDNNADEYYGTIPYQTGGSRNIALHFCHYQPA